MRIERDTGYAFWAGGADGASAGGRLLAASTMQPLAHHEADDLDEIMRIGEDPLPPYPLEERHTDVE